MERILDHGEATVRSFFERIPDGRYVGRGVLDSDGVGDGEVPFDVIVDVDGSSVRVDYTQVPDALPGPLNCPAPGPGRHRGGLGADIDFLVLEPLNITAAIERTKTSPPGLAGGHEGRANGATLVYPDGRRVAIAKATRVPLPEGTRLELRAGGGFGDPKDRKPSAVLDDVQEGYVTEEQARPVSPHAFVAHGPED